MRLGHWIWGAGWDKIVVIDTPFHAFHLTDLAKA